MTRGLGSIGLLTVLLSACGPDIPPAGPRDGAPPPIGVDAGPCPTGTTRCGEACVDITSTFAHCGACDQACSPGEVCSGSACLTGGCPLPTTDCGGSCVDTLLSDAHCGGCGMACPLGTRCDGGSCVCPADLELCGTQCVSTAIDAANCGTCGHACAAAEMCEAGTCVACGSGISYAADVQPIFTARCATGVCHTGTRPAGDLSLGAGQSYGDLVGVTSSGCRDGRARVVAGDPEGSLLYQKVSGVGFCGGNAMPPGAAAPLTGEQLQTIHGWICGGARND